MFGKAGPLCLFGQMLGATAPPCLLVCSGQSVAKRAVPAVPAVQAAALALREFPLVNASLAPDESAIVQHNVVNIGIAMNTPYGLVVPNIKNVQARALVLLLSGPPS
jgi:hypothetical protein